MGARAELSKVMETQNQSSEASAEECLPSRFGNLILLRRVARGGMGEVYLAAVGGIEGAERACVVKRIRREHQTDKSFRARFLDETRIQAQLQHPGVAQILDASSGDDDCPYAVVEYIEGRHLGEILSRSNQLGLNLDWADALAIGICFADALAHVHERKDAAGRPLHIAHRDLSPQNVMLGYAGDLKLIDFGTARGENRRCRTVSGIVYAKPGYVAPEVANQTPGGAPADIYAMGVMLWELVSGRRFLQGDAVEHQAQVAHGNRPLPPIARSVGAPPRLDEVITKLTANDVDDRYQSARLAVADLVELLKRAPSLADGDRSVRGRIAHMMARLYPAEPARSRADFARRVAHARQLLGGEKTGSTRPGVPEPSPSPPEAAEGEKSDLLGGTRYRLTKCISQGGMGEVWEAVHADLGRTVALKLMPEGAAESGPARQKFRSEARALARLKHKGLVDVFDFGVTALGRCYYAMELLEGQTVEERLKQGPIPWRQAVRLLCGAADALGAAHRAGIVHRDITPSNLFLTSEGNLKLLDFGVSKSQEPGDDETGEAAVVVGTPEYISPEQAAGGKADIRSDIYALGVVLYEMLTGSVPHPLGEGGSPTLPALLTAKITVPPRVPSTVGKGLSIPKGLDRACLRMLERDAERRVATTDAVLALLRPLDERRKERTFKLPVAVVSAAVTFGVLFAFSLLRTSAESGAGLTQPSVDMKTLAQRAELDASAPTREASLDEAEELEGDDGRSAEGSARTQQEVAAQEVEEDFEILDSPPASLVDPLADEVSEVLQLIKRGAKIKAHHRMKKLHSLHPESVAVARGLVVTARGVQAWGEAYDAAQFWVAHSDEPEASMALAQLERATLRGNPVTTLQNVLVAHPDYVPAQQLLEKYAEKKLATR